MFERLFLFSMVIVSTIAMDAQTEPTRLFDMGFPSKNLKQCAVKTIHQNDEGQQVIYDVDSAGNIVRLESKICYDCPVILDTSWIRMSFLYDEKGNLIRTAEYAKEGQEKDYKLAETLDLQLTYDAQGRLSKENLVHTLFDLKEPVISSTETLFQYDANNGQLLRKETRSQNGELNELLVCNYSGDTTFLTYTLHGFTQNTIEVRNERNQLVYVHNTFQTESGDTTSTHIQTYSYSQEGILLLETRESNGLKMQKSYEYDSSGDVVRISDKQYFKDLNDKMQESIVLTNYEYNEKGLLIREQFGYADIPPDKTYVISWQYVYW